MPKRPTDSKLLTDEIARSAPPPAAGNRIYYDGGDRAERLAGFGLRVTATGSRAFVLNYKIDGVERRDTIGHFPAWSVTEARDEARRRKRAADRRPAGPGLSLMTPEQLAADLGITPATLCCWRKQRIGPPAAQLGRYTWYRRAAVEAWLIALEQEGAP
jgi:hypothetical protein